MSGHVEIHLDIEKTQRHTILTALDFGSLSADLPRLMTLRLPRIMKLGEKLCLVFFGNLLSPVKTGWYEVVLCKEDRAEKDRCSVTLCLQPAEKPRMLNEHISQVFAVSASEKNLPHTH